jgi:hypothetical protein
LIAVARSVHACSVGLQHVITFDSCGSVLAYVGKNNFIIVSCESHTLSWVTRLVLLLENTFLIRCDINVRRNQDWVCVQGWVNQIIVSWLVKLRENRRVRRSTHRKVPNTESHRLSCTSAVFKEIYGGEVVRIVQLNGHRIYVSPKSDHSVSLIVYAWDATGSILKQIPETTRHLSKEFDGSADRKFFCLEWSCSTNKVLCYLTCVARQRLCLILNFGHIRFWLRNTHSDVLTLRQWVDVREVNSVILIG